MCKFIALHIAMKKIVLLCCSLIRSRGTAAASIPISYYPTVQENCTQVNIETLSCRGIWQDTYKVVDQTMDKVFGMIENKFPKTNQRLDYLTAIKVALEKKLDTSTLTVQDSFVYEIVHRSITNYMDNLTKSSNANNEICQKIPSLCQGKPTTTKTAIGVPTSTVAVQCDASHKQVCGIVNVCTNYKCYQNLKTYNSACEAEAAGADYIKPWSCQDNIPDFSVKAIAYTNNYEEFWPWLLSVVCNQWGDVFIPTDNDFATQFDVDGEKEKVWFDGWRFMHDECKDVYIPIVAFNNVKKWAYMIRVDADVDDLIKEKSEVNNRKQERVRLFDQSNANSSSKPDLYIASMNFDSLAGNLLFEVCNAKDYYEGFAMLRLESNGVIQDIAQKIYLNRGECEIYASSLDELNMRWGRSYSLWVTVDPFDQIAETNERNNTIRDNITLVDNRPDFYIAKIYEKFILSKHYATVQVCNEKHRFEGDIVIAMDVNWIKKQVTVSGILGWREYRCFDYPFALEQFGIQDGHSKWDYSITAIVDPSNQVNEMYENNNSNHIDMYAP